MLFCIRLPNFVQIGRPTTVIWRHIDFQNGGHQPCCICFVVMADHSQSAFRGLNSVLKPLVRRINSSRDIAIYRFWRFGLKLPIHALCGEFLGHMFPIWRHPSPWPPKGPSMGGNTSFEPFTVRISATVRPGCMTQKKRTVSQKSHIRVIFPLFGGKPPLNLLDQKLHGGWCLTT